MCRNDTHLVVNMRRNDSPELLLNATKTRGIEIFRGGQHASEWWSVCVGIGGQYASEYTEIIAH